MKRVARLLVATALALTLVAAPALSASADDEVHYVPVASLPHCQDPDDGSHGGGFLGSGVGADRGGWALRDFVATGAPYETELDVRVKALRLGEPCTDHDVPDGTIFVPATVREVPLDGDIEAGVSAGGLACRDSSDGTDCIQYLGMAEVEGHPGLLEACFNLLVPGGSTEWKLVRDDAHTDFVITSSLSGQYGGGSGIFGAPCHAAYPTANGIYYDGASIPISVYRCGSTDGTFCGDNAGLESGHPTVGGRAGSKIEVSPYTGSLETYAVCAHISATIDTHNEGTPHRYVFDDTQNVVPFDLGPTRVWKHAANMDLLGIAGDGQCPNLVELHVVVCVWILPSGLNSDACTETVWTADAFQRHSAYPQTAGGGLDGALCTVAPLTPGCYEVLHPAFVDYADFGSMCGDPPPVAWLDFTWLPSFIGYYEHCLFIPQGGWDWHGEIPSVWEHSAAGQLLGVMTSIGDSFSIPATCGIVLDASSTVLSSLQLDTCSWASWAAPVKSILGLGMSVAFGLWALSFVVQCVLSLFGGTPARPMSKG
jgi:hypothetical protein